MNPPPEPNGFSRRGFVKGASALAAIGFLNRSVFADAASRPTGHNQGIGAVNDLLTLDLAAANWSFRDTNSEQWHAAQVPGCVHRDLHRAGLIPDPFWGDNELKLQWIEDRDWEYRAEFALPAQFGTSSTVDLVADGLDTVADVFVNEVNVGSTENMFVGYRWPIHAHLRPGKNVLRIRFTSAITYINSVRPEHRPLDLNDSVARSTVIRKEPCQFGWDWGPRFVTAGIWKAIRLEASGPVRLESVHVSQDHQPGTVRLKLDPQLSETMTGITFQVSLTLGRDVVLTTSDLSFLVPNPKLWWPSGQGAQNLYVLTVSAINAEGRPIGIWTRRIGLRRIELDRHPDEWGESFRFVVNGRPVFAKGANWIPANAFVAGLTKENYSRDLQAAAAVNMNCVRLWGGGIYEDESFYDLCDELGLMVWHDFMFACALYPSDERFLESVRSEAIYQVKRIRHHACLALWCGNNEIPRIKRKELNQPAQRQGYEAIFHRLLPNVIHEYDGATAYWPSSDWRGAYDTDTSEGEKSGDTHNWEVWHGRKPITAYENLKLRFCSEFGMQSYPSVETQRSFCDPKDGNLFGPIMEDHQKNVGGNQKILEYVSSSYRYPKDQDALILLSQLNQAYAMKVEVEHLRRNAPRCMGTLYWQLNDCWPVASWSSIEFTGRWKPAHYAARRFFAPALISGHLIGEESVVSGNYRHSTIEQVEIHTCSDVSRDFASRASWQVRSFDGALLSSGAKDVILEYGKSTKQVTVDLAPFIRTHGRDSLYLRVALDESGTRVSENTVFLTAPRFLDLPRGDIETKLKLTSPSCVSLTIQSAVFQVNVGVQLNGIEHFVSDNYFDLYPNEPRTITINIEKPCAEEVLAKALCVKSLVDTYI